MKKLSTSFLLIESTIDSKEMDMKLILWITIIAAMIYLVKYLFTSGKNREDR